MLFFKSQQFLYLIVDHFVSLCMFCVIVLRSAFLAHLIFMLLMSQICMLINIWLGREPAVAHAITTSGFPYLIHFRIEVTARAVVSCNDYNWGSCLSAVHSRRT